MAEFQRFSSLRIAVFLETTRESLCHSEMTDPDVPPGAGIMEGIE